MKTHQTLSNTSTNHLKRHQISGHDFAIIWIWLAFYALMVVGTLADSIVPAAVAMITRH